MDKFFTTKGKTYHKYRNCKWLVDIPEEKIVFCDINAIIDQTPCRGCSKRADLLNSGFNEEEAREVVS